jgi:hypothetical protein
MSKQTRAAIFSAINIIAALWVYWYLIGGGWLTNHYHLNDPNVVNLVLAIFEPIAVFTLLAYWIWRTPLVLRLLCICAAVQLLIGLGFALFILLFALTWTPKLM